MLVLALKVALAKCSSITLKFLHMMERVLSGELFCMGTGLAYSAPKDTIA